jgi:hypothetical protein
MRAAAANDREENGERDNSKDSSHVLTFFSAQRDNLLLPADQQTPHVA